MGCISWRYTFKSVCVLHIFVVILSIDWQPNVVVFPMLSWDVLVVNIFVVILSIDKQPNVLVFPILSWDVLVGIKILKFYVSFTYYTYLLLF